MKTAASIALLSALLLVGCGSSGGDANSSAPAAPVAAAKPPAGQQWTEVVSKTAEGGYVMGNPAAPIKLVEYGSRLCPVCGAFAETGIKPLEEKYIAAGKVSYEFRDYMVHGAPDYPAAMLGRCVPTEAYFPLLKQFFAAQPQILPRMEGANDLQAQLQGKSEAQIATAWAEKMDLVTFVQQRGLPEAQARACLGDTKQFDALLKLTDTASNEKGVTGTPTFFINGAIVPNTNSWDGLEPALKRAGA